jgi:hypothetical protein
MASEELARKRLKSGTEIGQNQTDTIPTAEVSRIERVFPIRIQVPQRQLRASGECRHFHPGPGY